MVFATAAWHDQTLARRQSTIGAPDSETFKALADHGEAKGNRRALFDFFFAFTGTMTALHPCTPYL
jgi:hypothetical protein